MRTQERERDTQYVHPAYTGLLGRVCVHVPGPRDHMEGKYNENSEASTDTQHARSNLRRTLAVRAITISPVQNVTPQPCLVASSLQLQPAIAQATPALQVLLSEIIIEVDAILPQATKQSWLNGHSESFHLLKSNGCLLNTKTHVMQQSLSQCEDMSTQVPQLQSILLVASPHFQPSDLLTFTTH